MDILGLLAEHNPWWKTGTVEEVRQAKARTALQDLIRYLKPPQIISVIGPRRVGKTFLLKQLIQHLLDLGEEAKRIVYFPFDEILAEKPEIIEQVLEEYERSVLKGRLENAWIFFDEIQFVQKWEVILKRYYDLGRKLKFFVSGSSALHITKAKESLAGREYELTLRPMSFREFVYFRTGKLYQPTGLDFRKLSRAYEDLRLQSKDLQQLFSEYLLKGGYPELTGEADFENVRRYTESLLNKVVYKDLPKLFGISEPDKVAEILKIACYRPGFLLDYQSLAADLKLTRQTVAKYVGNLAKAGLITLTENWRSGKISGLKKRKKIYLMCPSLAAAFLHEFELLKIQPYLVETAFYQHFAGRYFWADAHEVDLILDGTRQAVEVKWTDAIAPKDLKGLVWFAKKRKYAAVVASRGVMERRILDGLAVHFVPAWLALLFA